nr:MAG TPA: hypothetical protein [Bacteriophage sp.]
MLNILEKQNVLYRLPKYYLMFYNLLQLIVLHHYYYDRHA